MPNSGYPPRPICHHPPPYRSRHCRPWSLVAPMPRIPSVSIILIIIITTTITTIMSTMGAMIMIMIMDIPIITTMATIMDTTSITNAALNIPPWVVPLCILPP